MKLLSRLSHCLMNYLCFVCNANIPFGWVFQSHQHQHNFTSTPVVPVLTQISLQVYLGQCQLLSGLYEYS